jgi:hypothetical protein
VGAASPFPRLLSSSSSSLPIVRQPPIVVRHSCPWELCCDGRLLYRARGPGACIVPEPAGKLFNDHMRSENFSIPQDRGDQLAGEMRHLPSSDRIPRRGWPSTSRPGLGTAHASSPHLCIPGTARPKRAPSRPWDGPGVRFVTAFRGEGRGLMGWAHRQKKISHDLCFRARKVPKAGRAATSKQLTSRARTRRWGAGADRKLILDVP